MRFKWNNISSLDILSLMHPDRSVHSLIYYLHLYSNKIPLNTYDIVVDYFFFLCSFLWLPNYLWQTSQGFFSKVFFYFCFFFVQPQNACVLKICIYWYTIKAKCTKVLEWEAFACNIIQSPYWGYTIYKITVLLTLV